MANQKQFQIAPSIHVQSGGSVNGDAVDLVDSIHPGGRNIKAFVQVTNTGADPDEVLDIVVEEAPDNNGQPGAWAPILGAAFAQFDVNASESVAELHFVTNQRFVRLVSTAAGATPVFTQVGGFLLEQRLA